MSVHYNKPQCGTYSPIQDFLYELNIQEDYQVKPVIDVNFDDSAVGYHTEYRYRIAGCDYDTTGVIDYIKFNGEYYYPVFAYKHFGDEGCYSTQYYAVSPDDLLLKYSHKLKFVEPVEAHYSEIA